MATIMPKNFVSLSIVLPPYDKTKNPNETFRAILNKITLATKPGGICCFFVEDSIDPQSDAFSMKTTKSFLEILDSRQDLLLDDKIIWIKSPKKNNSQTDTDESITTISFEDTPFTTIYVLVKKGSRFEPVDFREKSVIINFTGTKR